jgi:hypothetical protein
VVDKEDDALRSELAQWEPDTSAAVARALATVG